MKTRKKKEDKSGGKEELYEYHKTAEKQGKDVVEEKNRRWLRKEKHRVINLRKRSRKGGKVGSVSGQDDDDGVGGGVAFPSPYCGFCVMGKMALGYVITITIFIIFIMTIIISRIVIFVVNYLILVLFSLLLFSCFLYFNIIFIRLLGFFDKLFLSLLL